MPWLGVVRVSSRSEQAAVPPSRRRRQPQVRHGIQGADQGNMGNVALHLARGPPSAPQNRRDPAVAARHEPEQTTWRRAEPDRLEPRAPIAVGV
ncbi:hypothetical protein BHE74_00016050 [Ensete ventricosum]|uniref:Uncharacterized protein n=1 Tax=Ensete ventricosum TaxID=4639 RepID=A0A445MAJ6_ENSVE|nr:hypothetical protein BHE74_00016050 [Ensete ventricosum]RZR71249.1 hypothetical protein BHM03_00004235 [Ensete ventricosum]